MSDKDKPPGSGDRTDFTVFRPASAAPATPGPPPGAADSMPEATAPEDRTVFQPIARAGAIAPKPTAKATPPAGAPEDHTVIRPNPGGRRPAPSRSPEPAPTQMPASAVPRRAAVEEAEIGFVNAEPIMRAAGPLLVLLGRLRTTLLRAQVQVLVPQIVEALQKFETECSVALVPVEATQQAKYVLCATADEVIANLPDGDRVAAQASVTSRFFGESSCAQRFFEDSAAIKAAPAVHYALLQLRHACLALGFAGQSRSFAAESAALPQMQHDLYEKIARARPRGFQRLSPRWQGQAMPAHAVQLRVPFWALAGMVGSALFVLYLTLRTLLSLQAEQVAATLTSFNPAKPVVIARHAAVPPPAAAPPTQAQSAQLERIRKILGPNIDAGRLALFAAANQIIIRIPDHSVFEPGKATVLAGFRPLALYVALALDGEKGPIKVLVHSDNRTVGNDRYGSNFALSAERARAVGAILKQLLTQPNRVEAEGKGSDVPIASNDSEEGRAKNRRVEIVIDRSD